MTTTSFMHWSDDSERQRTIKALAFVADDYLQNLPGADLVFVCKNKGSGISAKQLLKFNSRMTCLTPYNL